MEAQYGHITIYVINTKLALKYFSIHSLMRYGAAKRLWRARAVRTHGPRKVSVSSHGRWQGELKRKPTS
jgi:hypothetical protein